MAFDTQLAQCVYRQINYTTTAQYTFKHAIGVHIASQQQLYLSTCLQSAPEK